MNVLVSERVIEQLEALHSSGSACQGFAKGWINHAEQTVYVTRVEFAAVRH